MGSMTSSRLSEEIIAVKTIESIEDVDIYNSNQPQIFESSGPVDMFKSGPAVHNLRLVSVNDPSRPTKDHPIWLQRHG
jgi:hypothetical protein